MRALLVTDLEGVAGADSVDCLLDGQPAWERSRRRATHEVNLAIAALGKQGFTEFIVSDSHRNGGDTPNVVVDALDARARYDFRHDAFAPQLFSGVSAVAALGMHAAGGAPGFVAHALDIGLAWECGGRTLSETDFLLGLCADAMTPFLFVTGDDALIGSLPPGVRGVVTKRWKSATRAESFALDVVDQAIASAALLPAVPAPPLPGGPLRLHVKRAVDDTSLQRDGECSFLVEGESTRARYRNALAAVDEVASVTGAFITAAPGEPEFVSQVEALLSAPWPGLATRR